MKLTVADLLAAHSGLRKIADGPRIAALDAFRIGQMILAIQPSMTAAAQARNAAQDKYGTKKDQEWIAPSDAEQMAAYVAEMNALLAEEVEVDFKPIPMNIFLDLLGKASEMTVSEVMALDPFHD